MDPWLRKNLRGQFLQSVGIAYTDPDELAGTGNIGERLQRIYSALDPVKIQQFLPLAASLVSAADPLAEFERLAFVLWGRGELFNLFCALRQLGDPRVNDFADHGLQVVERDLGVWLLKSAPDGELAIANFDAQPRGDVIARASQAYVTLKIAQYEDALRARGLDPIGDVAEYKAAREKA